ncbi:hypothetical protein WMY93_017336 [Mugilogobius chulae]|uniref:Kinesin-like protein KIF26A/B helical domain-containing protein n=1 Tax=Mugilogobius chulae TaxID=88201 RepID=A0AAW0P029_9GOBI
MNDTAKGSSDADGQGQNDRGFSVEGCPSGVPLASGELNPRKRLLSAEDARCCSRPTPEGAGSISISEEAEEKSALCQQCQRKVSELKEQVRVLADQNSLKDPGYTSFLFDQLQTSGSHDAGPGSCQVCSTPLQQLRQEALHTLHAPVLTLTSAPSFLPQPARFTVSSTPKQMSRSQGNSSSNNPPSLVPVGERHRVQGAGSKASVQVTVAGAQLTGSLSSVTIQAQQYLEGMWSISRVNNFLPQPKPVAGLTDGAGADVLSSEGRIAALTTSTTTSAALTPCRLRSAGHTGIPAPSVSSSPHNSSAATSFFIRPRRAFSRHSRVGVREESVPAGRCAGTRLSTLHRVTGVNCDGGRTNSKEVLLLTRMNCCTLGDMHHHQAK